MMPMDRGGSSERSAQIHPEQALTAYGPVRPVSRSDRGDQTDVLALTPASDDRTVSTSERANQLALRFAYMLARRHHMRGLLLDDSSDRTGAASIATLTHTTKRKSKSSAVSKSCATRRRRDFSAKPSRLARAYSASRGANVLAAEERDRESLEATIRELRSSIAQLEQSQLLNDSARVTHHLNRTGVVVDVCRQYFLHFAHGYDSLSALPVVAARSAATRAFFASTVERDVVARDFRGADAWLDQWQLYTTCYDDLTARLCSLQVIDDDDRYISVGIEAELRFVFNATSIETLYPHLHAQLATSAAARAMAEMLYGRECCVAFDIVFHFNERGRLSVHESRANLASALLDVTTDPSTAMAVLNASVMTEDGHWRTAANSTEVHKNTLPVTILGQE